MGRPSGLVHGRHRRGRRRRTQLRLALQVALAICAIAIAAALSAGVIHVVERPVSPFEPVSDQERRAFQPAEPRVEPATVDSLESADPADSANAPDLPTAD